MTRIPAGSWRWQEFASRDALAQALSGSIAASLAAAAGEKGHGLLAVSGGTTPAMLFQALSREAIDWQAMVVTLCDERFVPPSSPRSNEGLVRRELLQNRGAGARFVPLFRDTPAIGDAAAESAVALAALPLPLDVALLGMGGDGHTASFFPDADELEAALDPAGEAALMVIHAKSAGEPRLSLTLPILAAAHRLVLHIEGAAKRETFEQAIESQPALPVRRVIEAAKNPVEVFWAP